MAVGVGDARVGGVARGGRRDGVHAGASARGATARRVASERAERRERRSRSRSRSRSHGHGIHHRPRRVSSRKGFARGLAFRWRSRCAGRGGVSRAR